MADTVQLPPHYRRNSLCFIGDYVFFGLGLAFISSSTVLPSFVRKLTASTVLIGLLSTIQNGCWLFPQLFVAKYLRGRSKLKQFMILPGLLGRLVLLITAIVVAQAALSKPALTLAVLFTGHGLFFISDSMCSVPWFDLLAKAIPPERRGRLIGTAQVLYGFATLGVAALVAYILSPESRFVFPTNYALLFALAGVTLFLSLFSILLIKEPPATEESTPISSGEYLRLLWDILTKDRVFITTTITRLLVGYSTMAYPFYVIHATEVLDVGAETIGVFILAQTIGGILGGILLGRLNEKRGSRAVINVSIGLNVITPMLALLIPFLAASSPSAAAYLYVPVFAAMGLYSSSMMLGFISLYMEIAPEEDRPVYMGFANTLNGLTLLAPLLGGWILQEKSYHTLFLTGGACALLAMPCSFFARSKNPLQENTTEHKVP